MSNVQIDIQQMAILGAGGDAEKEQVLIHDYSVNYTVLSSPFTGVI